MHSPSVFQITPENLKSFLEFDARESFLKGALSIRQANDEELSLIDELNSKAAQQQMPPVQLAALEDYDINTALANFFVISFLYQYDKYIESGEANVTAQFDYLYLAWNKRGDDNAGFLQLLLEATENLAKFSLTETNTDELYLKLGRLCYTMGIELESDGALEAAVANIHTGISFTRAKNPAASLEMFNRLILIARKAGLSDLSTYLFQKADLTSQLAKADSNKRIEFFDAAEQLIRYVVMQYRINHIKPEPALASNIELVLNTADYLNILRPLFYYGLDLLEAPPGLDSSVIYKVLWDQPIGTWNSKIVEIQTYSIEIANNRFNLLNRTVNTLTRFNDVTIQYKNLLEAVPLNKSVLKEEYIDTILTDLKHELIHVYSLFGSIGTVLHIMRWLLVDLEIFLVANVLGSGSSKQSVSSASENLLNSKRPVQLTKPDLVSLSYVERSAAIEKKIQIIENVWIPWFEGLAVFGEFVDDPELDKEIESPLTTVIKNLVDVTLQQEAKERKISLSEMQDQHNAFTEALYSNALKKNGPYKLRTYLESYHKKYLPGYLCVRSILAKWRKNYPAGPIPGDKAFRLLLHMTRFSGIEIIPDLGLPLSAFKEAAIEKHFEWLQNISDISNQDLKEFLNQDAAQAEQPVFWSKGKLSRLETENNSNYIDQFRSKAIECLSYLTGDNGDIYRIEEGTPETAMLLKDIAEGVGEHRNKPRMLNDQSANFLLGRHIILPFAQALCPFWLLENDNILSCLVRTRESDVDHGRPSYTLLSFTIPADDIKQIRQLLLKSGNSNLTLTRAIVLGGYEKYMKASRQFLVFQYEEWMHVQSVGMFWGQDPPKEITEVLKDRFLSNKTISFKESINNPGYPLAKRTKQWIEENRWDKVLLETLEVDAQQWAGHVLGLCNDILENRTDDIDDVSARMLKFIFIDDAVARNIYDNGLGFLFKEDPSLKMDFINFIFKTAYLPVSGNAGQAEMINKLTGDYNYLISNNTHGIDLTTLK